jgi:hypothetical protein
MYIDYDFLLARIPADARVLDLGGWDKVFSRANVVVDLNPYATRRNLNPERPERFGEDDWIIADFCSSKFWETIPDKAFDFVTIGHTLEDIRDPLYVCSQMIRCAKAGYIEAPSKFRELSKLNRNDTWSGYSHHRWIIEPMADLTGLIFKAKLGWAHHEDFLGSARRHLLADYFHHFDGYFWSGSFRYVEHFAVGPVLETQDARWYFDHYVQVGRQRNNLLDLVPNQSSPDDGRCLWPTEYELPSEYAKRTGKAPSTFQRYFSPRPQDLLIQCARFVNRLVNVRPEPS